MKKCNKCGTLQSDNVKSCVDCNEPLGKPLSYYEAKQAMAGDLSDLLYVSKTDKIFIALHISGLLTSILAGIFLNTEYQAVLSSLAGLAFIVGIPFSAFPKAIWNLNFPKSCLFIHKADNLRPSSYFISLLKAYSLVTLILGYILLIPTVIKFFQNLL